MISVILEACNRCGECISACPVGSIRLFNDVISIDQGLCEGCQACVDACPQGALVFYGIQPTPVMVGDSQPDPLRIMSTTDQSNSPSNQSLVWPAISSMLLWTGREVLPRLTDLALDCLNQRINAKKSEFNHQNLPLRDKHINRPGDGRRRRQRLGRYRKSD